MGAELIPRISVVTAAAGQFLTVEEAKANCRVVLTVTDDDELLVALIKAAQDRIESETGRALLTQTLDVKLDRWPLGPIDVPKPSLRSVTSITYVDTAGTTQTWSSSLYQVSAPSGPTSARGRIVPAYGQVYPVARNQMDAITVRISAGYGEASDVPQALKQAGLLMVGEWYDVSRSGSVVGTSVAGLPFAASALLAPYRVPSLRME